MGLAMDQNEVLLDPSHQVVLESTLDDLVKDIRCNSLTDICMREVLCVREVRHEWLEGLGGRLRQVKMPRSGSGCDTMMMKGKCIQGVRRRGWGGEYYQWLENRRSRRYLLSHPQRCHIGPIACPSPLHVPALQ